MAKHREMSQRPSFKIFVNSASIGNPGRGSWSATVSTELWSYTLQGDSSQATKSEMELTAVVAALETIKMPSAIELHGGSGQLEHSPTIDANRPNLSKRLKRAVRYHKIEWIRGK